MGPEAGMLIYGYCNGYFGRDSYATKRIEAIGIDWIVARGIEEKDAEPEFAQFPNTTVRNQLCGEWSINR